MCWVAQHDMYVRAAWCECESTYYGTKHTPTCMTVPNPLYFAGILLLRRGHNESLSGWSTLLVAPRNLSKEMWDGPRIDPVDARRMFGVDTSDCTESLTRYAFVTHLATWSHGVRIDAKQALARSYGFQLWLVWGHIVASKGSLWSLWIHVVAIVNACSSLALLHYPV